MKAAILRLADRLNQSYWFLPSLMAFAALLLAGGMVWLDSWQGSGWMDGLPWLYASRPSGARQVLSAIGGSMITVAGTVFSVTIAAVVYASGQYGPRLLSNFMRDRGNQVTLGTFIATFLYCLLVLRTIRSPDEHGGGGIGFVPNLALLVAVLLAICSIAVLIYFIHHVPSNLHINSVIEDVGERLLKEVGQRFPRSIGAPRKPDDVQDEEAIPPAFRSGTEEAADQIGMITACDTGYVQLVDDDALLHAAHKYDVVLRLQRQPGDFVHVGRPLIALWPAERCNAQTEQMLRRAFSVGAQRTALQDIRFLIDELVEIAGRALSPGINDPFTAVTCLDWLGAALSDVARGEAPSPLREDEDGRLRVIACPLTFSGLLDRSFGAMAQYCAGDMIAARRYLSALGEIAEVSDEPDRVAALFQLAERFRALAGAALNDPDRERILASAAELQESL